MAKGYFVRDFAGIVPRYARETAEEKKTPDIHCTRAAAESHRSQGTLTISAREAGRDLSYFAKRLSPTSLQRHQGGGGGRGRGGGKVPIAQECQTASTAYCKNQDSTPTAQHRESEEVEL